MQHFYSPDTRELVPGSIYCIEYYTFYIAGPHHDDVVGVMGKAGGHCSGAQPISLQISDPHVTGAPVTLYDGDLQDVSLQIYSTGKTLARRRYLSVNRADYRPRPAVPEVFFLEKVVPESVMGGHFQAFVDRRWVNLHHSWLNSAV